MPSNAPGNLSGGFSWRKIKGVHNRLRRFAIRSRIVKIIVRERRGPAEALAALARESESGTTWEFIVGGGGGSLYPFLVTDLSDEEGAKLGVRFGSVTDYINTPVSPAGMVESNDPPFTVLVSVGDTVIYLDVTIDTALASSSYGEIIAVDVAAAPTLPGNDYGAGHFYQTLRTFSVDGATTPPTITLNDQQAGGSFGFVLSGESGLFASLGPP